MRTGIRKWGLYYWDGLHLYHAGTSVLANYIIRSVERALIKKGQGEWGGGSGEGYIG